MEKPRPDLIRKMSIHLAEAIEKFTPKASEVEIITAIAMLALSACMEAKLSTEHFTKAIAILEQTAINDGLLTGSN